MNDVCIYTLIQIPEFNIKYEKDKSYGYDQRGEQRNNLKRILLSATNGHCMYCYRKVFVDNNDYSQIEHAIEKGKSKNSKLRNCLPNLGLACSVCNVSAKRKNESKRIDGIKSTTEYLNLLSHKCVPSQCRCVCDDYKRLRFKYQEGDWGHICLQPWGTMFEKTGHIARIQYNVLNGRFEPSNLVEYTEDEKQFIVDHINQFNLNDFEKGTKEFYKYCHDVINGDINYRKLNLYDNYIVDLFIESVAELEGEYIKEICKLAYLAAKARGAVM